VQPLDTPAAVGGPTSGTATLGRYLARSGQAGIGSRLDGKRILVVEDEFLLADEIVDWLRLQGAEPVGPAAMLSQAQKLIEHDRNIDAAVLDINLAGTMVFPLALELQHRGVPILFASAYAEEVILPKGLSRAMRLKKPFSEVQLIRAVELALVTAP
jgi:DNA-binding response OmpR family regulator